MQMNKIIWPFVGADYEIERNNVDMLVGPDLSWPAPIYRPRGGGNQEAQSCLVNPPKSRRRESDLLDEGTPERGCVQRNFLWPVEPLLLFHFERIGAHFTQPQMLRYAQHDTSQAVSVEALSPVSLPRDASLRSA